MGILTPITLLLLVVAGVPIYFLCRWAARKFFRKPITQRIATWVATVLVTPVACWVGVLTLLFVGTWHPDRDFTPERWASSPQTRYQLSEELIESRRLIGMTDMDIKRLLGEPESLDSAGMWIYPMGCIFMDKEYLEVDFRDGRATSVRSPLQGLPRHD